MTDPIEPDDVDTDPVDDKDADGTDKLGDAGKKALDEMKSKWRTERDARKALEARIAAADRPADDKPADAEKIRKDAQAEARAEVLKDRALDKIEARAAKLFADPEDARLSLAGQVGDFIDDGKLDVDEIDKAIEALLKKKPHLAAATAKRFQGGADGGARNGSAGPQQLTEQDLKRMSPEQIVKARESGQLDDLLKG